MNGPRLILLDRDGVLNDVVVDPEHGTIDSPLHPAQVVVPAWVPGALAALTEAGWILSVVTNQPAWAKGKTTRANLEATHEAVLQRVQAEGGRIESSFMCLHRSEDGCPCRKPRPTMLLQALERHRVPAERAWMVGDGVTDVQAGAAAGVRTAFLGPAKDDARRIFHDRGLVPDFWGSRLDELVRFLENEPRAGSGRGP